MSKAFNEDLGETELHHPVKGHLSCFTKLSRSLEEEQKSVPFSETFNYPGFDLLKFNSTQPKNRNKGQGKHISTLS